MRRVGHVTASGGRGRTSLGELYRSSYYRRRFYPNRYHYDTAAATVIIIIIPKSRVCLDDDARLSSSACRCARARGVISFVRRYKNFPAVIRPAGKSCVEHTRTLVHTHTHMRVYYNIIVVIIILYVRSRVCRVYHGYQHLRIYIYMYIQDPLYYIKCI